MRRFVFFLMTSVIILVNATLGAWSIIEILSWFGKTIPLVASVVIGLIAGKISIPIAIIGWILRICGVL